MNDLDFRELSVQELADLEKIQPAHEYTDFVLMVDDTRRYKEAHPNAKFANKDEPMSLKIGWFDETHGKYWLCGITDMKRSLEILDSDDKDMITRKTLLFRATHSMEGRENLLLAIDSIKP